MGGKILVDETVKTVEGIRFVRPWFYVVEFKEGGKKDFPANSIVKVVE